jgi:hypothetical protein
MLGYVPRECNELVSLLVHYGHAAVLEAKVIQVDERDDPWNQVRAVISVVDGR